MKCLHGMDARWCSHCTGFVVPVNPAHVLRSASPELMALLRTIGAKCVKEIAQKSQYRVVFKACHTSEVAQLHAGDIDAHGRSYSSISCKDAYLQLTVLRGQDLL